MYLLFFLLPALVSVKANTEIYDVKMTAMNLSGLEISFRLRGDTSDQLTGLFEVEHDNCGVSKYCGKTNDYLSIQFRDLINIPTVLDPCSNHTGIKIKASKFEQDGGGVVVWKRNWVAIDCNNTSDTHKEKAKAEGETNVFTEKNSFILTIAVLAIIALAVTVSVIVIMCKKQNKAKRKRSEQMKTDQNPVYGTYEEGPVYNIVTDQNAYYSS